MPNIFGCLFYNISSRPHPHCCNGAPLQIISDHNLLQISSHSSLSYSTRSPTPPASPSSSCHDSVLAALSVLFVSPTCKLESGRMPTTSVWFPQTPRLLDNYIRVLTGFIPRPNRCPRYLLSSSSSWKDPKALLEYRVWCVHIVHSKKIQWNWSAMYCMFVSDWSSQMYSNKDEVRQSSKCSFTIIKNLKINLCHREESSTSEQWIWSSLPKGAHHWSKERPICKIKKSRLMKDYFRQFSSNLMLWSYPLYLQSVSNLLWLERDRSEKWQQI